MSSNNSDEGAIGLEQCTLVPGVDLLGRGAEDSADGLVEDRLEALLREGGALEVLNRTHILRHRQALKSVASVISVIPGSYPEFGGLKT